MITEGSLQDFRLPDLLQILAIGNASGTLTLKSEGRAGHLYVREGKLVGARLGDRWGKAAACDLFLWETGIFDFGGELPESLPDQGELDMEAIARDGMRQLERKQALLSQLPDFFSPRTWVYPMEMYAEAKPLLVEHLGSGMRYADLARSTDQGELFILEELLRLYQADQVGLSCAPEELLRQLFDRVANELFSQFASISGVKMVEGLENSLNEQAREANLAVRWRGGKVQDNVPDTWSKEQLLEAYRPLLATMQAYVGKIYGPAFLERVIAPVLEEASPPQRQLWNELEGQPTLS